VTEHVLTSQYLHLTGGNLHDLFVGSADGEDQDSVFVVDALADARLGIPQGSAVSTLVAEIMLAFALRQVPKIGTLLGYADNNLVTSKSKCDAVSMLKALWSACQAHPVGRLRPTMKAFDAGAPIDFLGHRLTPNGGMVHTAPNPRNEAEFEGTMAGVIRRLKKPQSASQKTRMVLDAARYVRSWTAAFSLCAGIEARKTEWMHRLATA
jgi:hypothetical protein